MSRHEQVIPEVKEKGGKMLLLEDKGQELIRCLKLVEWRSWQLLVMFQILLILVHCPW